ncbi:MAG TPA: TIGR03435 family protein [Acidobacteriaceae bacterium]|nr:TIGR03435 family protein [Acidobacteriaceae bacterium]
MPSARTLAALFSLLTLAAFAQSPAPVARVFHPSAPLPSYDVATIKPYDPTPPTAGRMRLGSTNIRNYIRAAYSPAANSLASTQVVGGPEWLDKDQYTIQGKPPSDLEVAMKTMKNEDRLQLDHAMRQSLLADRLHLKVHFEVREMPIYALVPAKGGLKIKPVDTSLPPAPNSPVFPAPNPRSMSPGSIQVMMGAGGVRMLRASSISMAQFAGMIGGFIEQTSPNVVRMDTGSRPILDQTGFTGNFDLDNLKWSASLSAAPDAAADTASTPNDAPSLTTALEETLGLKLISTKGPVEVVVIDSIDHPSEN